MRCDIPHPGKVIRNIADGSANADHSGVSDGKRDIERLGLQLGRLIDELDPDRTAHVDLTRLGDDFDRLVQDPPVSVLRRVADEIEASISSPAGSAGHHRLNVSDQVARLWIAGVRSVSQRLDRPSAGLLHVSIDDRDRSRFRLRYGRDVDDVEGSAFGLLSGLTDRSRSDLLILIGWDARYLHMASTQRAIHEAQAANDRPFLKKVAAALMRNERYTDLGDQKQQPRGQAFMVRLLRRLTYGGRRSFDDAEYAELVYERLSEIFRKENVSDKKLLTIVNGDDPGRRAYFMQKFLPLRGFRRPKRKAGD